MIKSKFKFLIVGMICLMAAGIFSWGVANASNSLLYVSPNNLDKEVGENFVLAATVDTAGSKVCAVEGKLQLDKLSCQNIVVEEGMMAQKSPSCADSSFLLGIPNCTTENKTLFTVAVKAETAGTATVGFTNVDVVGEGFSLSSTSVDGNYSISAAPVAPVIDDTDNAVVPAENCTCEDWSDWQRVDCGAGDCKSTKLSQIRSRDCSPDNCETTVENRCVADAYCASAILPTVDDSTQTASQETSEIKTGLMASIGMISGEISKSVFLMIVVILSLLGLGFIGIKEWKLFQKKRKK